jgi:2-polyprenyl-3-methyl-5-hydroxy-6-metoxy-1,4-benzoquinol methylase
LATVFRLNKPLTFGATFVNNPLLQPFLVFFSVELGHYILGGELLHLNGFQMKGLDLRREIAAWFTGSIILGILLGMIAASIAFLLVHYRSRSHTNQRSYQRDATRFVKSFFLGSPRFARGFVRWKIRLDKMFSLLLLEDLRQGSVIDLGCGYGIALALTAFQHHGRRLIGCDLDEHRVRIASQALSPLKAELSVSDVRTFEFSQASLIMILDVLQYLDSADQRALLKRCCSLLEPGGKLIFRVQDREQGVMSTLTMAFDEIIFRLSGSQSRPTALPRAEFVRVLEDAGMKVKQRLRR